MSDLVKIEKLKRTLKRSRRVLNDVIVALNAALEHESLNECQGTADCDEGIDQCDHCCVVTAESNARIVLRDVNEALHEHYANTRQSSKLKFTPI